MLSFLHSSFFLFLFFYYEYVRRAPLHFFKPHSFFSNTSINSTPILKNQLHFTFFFLELLHTPLAPPKHRVGGNSHHHVTDYREITVHLLLFSPTTPCRCSLLPHRRSVQAAGATRSREDPVVAAVAARAPSACFGSASVPQPPHIGARHQTLASALRLLSSWTPAQASTIMVVEHR